MGENVFAETNLAQPDYKASILDRLGFSSCRLSLAVPERGGIKSLQDLEGLTIATTYPNLLQDFLKRQGVDARTLVMQGSVEVAPRLKIADAICDIVASGGTLAANNLCEQDVVLQSEALLIGRAGDLSAAQEETIKRLRARMRGALQAEDSKYIMLHAPADQYEKIVAMLPGAESPTILPLQGDSNKVALHAVCREAVFWETLENMKAAGASSILVVPIEKMMG